MSAERLHPVEPDILEYFALKGTKNEAGTPRAPNRNGLKVRRVMQIIRDMAREPFDNLSILDLACGEGVYAIEAALRGARVHALDGRTERMNYGIEFSGRLGLENLTFEQRDVRTVTLSSHGEYHVVLFLGILYHLDVPDSFHVLHNLASMCRQLLIIDTHFAHREPESAEFQGRRYTGLRIREHGEEHSLSERKKRVMASIDNTFSFWFTRESLIHLLADVGFTSVLECHAPLEPYKPKNRITLVATKGSPITVSTYPWINDRSREELDALWAGRKKDKHRRNRWFMGKIINPILRPFGYETQRLSRPD